MGNSNHSRDVYVYGNVKDEVGLSQKDMQCYNGAVALARNGEHRVRVGALAVVSGKKVAGAFNTFRNDPANTSYRNATYHAEMNALCQVSERLLSRVTLYIARLDIFHNQKPSAPCKYCDALCRDMGIKAIVYLDPNLHLVKERL